MKRIKLSIIALLLATTTVYPCTSIAWNTKLGTFTTRTNDWVEATSPRLRGIKKGATRDLSGYGSGERYTTKYDIFGVLTYGELVHDGVNSEGLQMNALFYSPMTSNSNGTIEVSQFVLGEYLLANYANVEEVVDNIEDIKLSTLTFDNMPMDIKVHWSLTDKSGDRLVIQYDKDGLNLYRGEEASVMTNDPSQREQLEYARNYQDTWADATRDTDYGSIGNGNSTSRFVHASYFLSHLDEPTSIINGLNKLSAIPYRVPQDAPYTDMLGTGEVSSYGTEWILTQNLETGHSVFEYKFEDNFNLVKYNVYDLMGTDVDIDLTNEQLPQKYR